MWFRSPWSCVVMKYCMNYSWDLQDMINRYENIQSNVSKTLVMMRCDEKECDLRVSYIILLEWIFFLFHSFVIKGFSTYLFCHYTLTLLFFVIKVLFMWYIYHNSASVTASDCSNKKLINVHKIHKTSSHWFPYFKITVLKLSRSCY